MPIEALNLNREIPLNDPGPEARLSRQDNVVTIEKPEGVYIISYGNHWQPQRLDNLRLDKSDGLILETAGNDWTVDPLTILYAIRDVVQYRELFARLEAQPRPIYFADTVTTKLPYLLDLVPPPVEWLAGQILLGQAFLRLTNGQACSRREFLATLGKALAGTWMFTALSVWGALGVEATNLNRGKTTRIFELTKTINKAHPEVGFFAVALRNLLLAQKEQWLMEELGSQPQLTTVIGGAHLLIEDAILEEPETRLNLLKSLKPLLNLGANSDSFDKIFRLDYNGAGWGLSHTYQIPELEELEL